MMGRQGFDCRERRGKTARSRWMRGGGLRGDMKITVLVENATPSSRLAACHGLSLLVEAADQRILFDVGPDATLLANARALDVDIACVDAVVISHGHADHGGGLGAYLEATQGSRAPVYVREDAFIEHRSGTFESNRSISLDPVLADHPRVVRTAEHTVLGQGVELFSVERASHPAPSSNARLFRVAEGPAGEAVLIPDDFAHEQSLLVNEGGKRVLVSGCSHAGILNIMDRAEELAGAPLDVVFAGFHLMSPSLGEQEGADAVESLGRELARRGATYYTFHCTGMEAFARLRDMLGDRVRYLACGSVVRV